MIRGYNFPSGSEEKVTIDDSKVTEKMNLYSFRNQVILDIKTPPSTEPSGYTYQGELYDGSKLYMKTTLTRIKNGSDNSSDGCTGTILLIKPDGTQLSIEIPTYTIPIDRSETGTDPDYYDYDCYLICQFDNDVYLRIDRKYTILNEHSSNYSSIYKLNIGYSSLSWTTKVIELFHRTDNYFCNDNLIIEDDYIYACDGSGYYRYIYGYKYEDTPYTFQKISTKYIYNSVYDISDCDLFVRKGTNTYIFFWVHSYSSSTLTNEWISITRNSDGTYSEASGTAYLSGYHKSWKMFMLKGEVYIQMLGYDGYEGLQYYKLNSDNSAWKVEINFSTTATPWTTDITYYFNGSPKQIFQGRSTTYVDHPPTVRNDGTFDLTIFTPGKLSFENLQTPTINNTIFDFNNEEWYLYKYICNDKNQIAFFFSIGQTLSASPPCKCVLEAMDGNPVLYSTFKEDDIIG